MKKIIAMLLFVTVILGAFSLVSCDKNDKNKNTTDGQVSSETKPSENAGTIDGGTNTDPDENDDGKLNVGEDDEGDKWGEFIPYN